MTGISLRFLGTNSCEPCLASPWLWSRVVEFAFFDNLPRLPENTFGIGESTLPLRRLFCSSERKVL